MWTRYCVLFVFFFGISAAAQELNANVTVNSERIQQTNKQVFTTLQNSIRDFLNNTKFTNINARRNEQINCSVLLVVEEYDPNSNTMKGVFQVQSSRPIYNSGYSSPVFAFRDNHVSFNYIEFEALTYSENNISSNLVALLSFYAHVMIGFDADTFSKNGGTDSYQKASLVVSMMQGSGSADQGWIMGEPNNRYALSNDLLSGVYDTFRQALYDYHINGIDWMADDPEKAKQGVANAIFALENLHRTRSNAFLTRLFFDAKSDEVVQIFSAGPRYDNTKLIESLTRISPLNGSKWNRM